VATPVSAAAAVLLLGCVLWSAFLVGCALVRASPSARWCAAAVAAYGLELALFWLLVPAQAFRLEIVLGASLLTALALHAALARRLRPVAMLAADLARLRELLASRVLVALALAGGLVILVRTARGLAAPPLAWDALTYHLLKAGRFVQSGGLAAELAPDAWGYYEYFPPGSEIVYAWGMLPGHGDAFVALTGLLIWIGAVVATFGAARALGAAIESSGLAALAVGLVPGVTQHLMSAYSDIALLAGVLLAFVFVQRSGAPGQAREAILAAVALGLCAVIKHQGLPIAAAGGLLLAWRTRRAPRFAAGAALACAAAAVVMLPAYARAWIDTGSPVFPLRVEIAGRVILPGHEGLGWLLYDNW
jgi:hypothetical protein